MHLIFDEDTVYSTNYLGGIFAKMWHGLETLKERILPSGEGCEEVFQPIVQCGLRPDFEAEVNTIATEDQEEVGINLADYKLILADCRKGKSGKVLPLHVPKKGYTIHQNLQLFDALVGAASKVVGDDGFEIVSLGTLGCYSQFICSLAIKGQASFDVGKLADGRADTWYQFFGLNSSHNGLVSSGIDLSTVRRECMNRNRMAIAQAEEQGTRKGIKHTASSTSLINANAFAQSLDAWLKGAASLKKTLVRLKTMPLDLAGFQAFAAGVFTDGKSDSLSTNSYNRIQESSPRFTRGMGNVGETFYDGICAITESLDYAESGMKPNKRVAYANFGRGNDWKNRAIEMASANDLDATMRRGRMLYDDKVKLVASLN